MPSDAQTQLLAALAERYRIERELGAGGMATVYLAHDLKHDREVALKVLRPELGAVLGAERFLAEIRITARLDHPHILTLIDSGAAGGLLYYVLPFVRGESLREKLNREKQLSIEEALTITKQIASALDYAHRQGVVHRDIKPENILLHEGEAMLADFGIALGVSEAGGNRLTETGLSLGTPQYMSPEQATGDRQVDARSDVYSIGAVLYEMLAGEPPVTGPTAQAMIAKLMTERPTRVRVVRPSVPAEVDAAVAKALDKTPADRYATAGDFMRALDVRAPAEAPKRRAPAIAVAVTALAIAGAIGALVATKKSSAGAEWVLKDRAQLTFTGGVLYSAISQDGKQLAYWTRHCSGANCQYAVEVQDVGGTTSRRVFDGATGAYGIEWSPDRRNLLIAGTVNRRSGYYLLSTLGGAPRFLSTGAVTFWGGGDSLLVAQPFGAGDSVHWVYVSGLDGTVGDSIRVSGFGGGITGLSVQPGGRWIVALIIQKGHGFWQVIDRKGNVSDQVTNSCTCPGIISAKALFLQRAGQGFESIVRVGLDDGGKLAKHQDTLFSGRFNGFSVTADGASMVIDDGAEEYSVWAEDLADAFKGNFPEAKRVLRASTPLNAFVSPDGQRLLVSRVVTSGTGQIERRYSIAAFDGSGEKPLGSTPPRVAFWVDSVQVLVGTLTPAGLHVALIDARSGATGRTLDLPDSIYRGLAPLADGWAWIPANGDRIVVQRGGKTIEIPKPRTVGGLQGMGVDPTGKMLLVDGWSAAGYDTLMALVAPVSGGALTPWAADFAETGGSDWLPDGSILYANWPAQETVTLYRVRAPMKLDRLGTVQRAIDGFSVSSDLKRAAVRVRDYKGDAWMSKIVRP